MITETVVGVACVLIGLVVILNHFAPESPATVLTPATHRAQLTRSLGLGHRFAARVIASSYRPADQDLVAAAALYQLSPLRLSPAHTDIASPLLELEQLLERVDQMTTRARSWGQRGRARGTL